MLESLVRSKVARKILTLFFTHPDEKFYIRQLERLIHEPVSAIRRELFRLEKSGLLSQKREANLKYYWINRQYPIFEEMRGIILKTQGLGDYLKELFKKTQGIKVAFIFGSVAQGRDGTQSDIDLMVIGNIDSVQLHARINKIEDITKRKINYHLMDEECFRKKKSAFFQRVLKDKKIFIVGTEDDLRKLSQTGKD